MPFFASSYRDSQIRGDQAGALAVYFLDVGQGDATLIRTPSGDDIIIDGGPNNVLIKKLGVYLPFYDKTIETIILTHPDNDHVAGLVEVLRRYKVEKILMTRVLSDSPSYQSFLDEVEINNIEVEVIASEETVDFGDGVFFNILYPIESFAGKTVESTNNTSITGQLVYASTSVMLTGDLEVEESLVARGLNLKSDIYHVGHHGSNNANDLKFVSAVNPKYAVISVGADNHYGHPQYRTLKNLESVGAEIFRTDKSGDLIFYSNGLEFSQLQAP
ncbi:MAG: ComEC/Rec2 family competence protein [Candidatus Buchananbacteria bacterium]|nr:ComEC/Rec2 family competence protein [Candidatus Buchananbacteria bacterium]